jgi:hypothetical protein
MIPRVLTSLLLGSSSLFLVQCTPVLQGEAVDIATLGKPDIMPEPVTQPKPLTPHAMPPLAAGAIRAWIPRMVSANGDTVEGHYLDISPLPPKQESVAPAKPIPRPPKGALPQSAPKRKPQEAIHQPPIPPLPQGSPGFPGSSPFPMPGGPGYEPLVP